ncbi:MAG: primosomal protein N' (replication factor Y) - superfamily II helicase [Amylibacter sp.]|jgi:DNA-directed RNA polymerase subunit RPC12/RpoP|nr:primosomal protein N' (replication factor Y) - superfamily II helicase [Amylibacter sp.]
MDAAPIEHKFPCNTCGSDMRFAPGTNQLLCDHCGAVEPIGSTTNATAIKELDFKQALRDELPKSETAKINTISCENCGAHVEFDSKTHAAECPFCATPVVTGTGTERQIKPRALVPFVLSEPNARRQMTDWLGSLWFAPNGLQEYARKGRALQGIYVPYWTYDADTKSTYSGSRGDIYYVTEQVRVKRDGKSVVENRQVQKVRWSPARGRVARFFDDVLVLASKSLPKSYTDALAPWDLSALTPYDPQYLAGLRAEGYTIALDDGFDEARHHMDRMILRDVKFDIGGDKQRVNHVDTAISDVTFKHVLLPIWMAAYKYRGTTYRFVVNGQTGAVRGERPYSKIKIAIAIISGLIIAGLLGAVIALNGQT